MSRRIVTGFSFLVLLVLFAPARSWGQAADSFGDLASRIDRGDRLRVEDRSGSTLVGELVRVGRDSLVIRSGGEERRYAPESVRAVTLLHHPFWASTIVGAGAGAIVGALSECRGGPHAECSDGLIMAGGLGAGLGAAVATLIEVKTIVYQPDRQSFIAPAISPRGVAIRLVRRW